MRKGFFIDPSGLGTTGGCLVNLDTGEVIKFYKHESKEWLEHVDKLVNFCKKEEPNIIVYETTTYISPTNRGHHMTSLFKLFGGIESLKYSVASIEKIENMTVNSVKSFKDRVLNRGLKIDGIEYSSGRGRGWSVGDEKVVVHQLEAYLIYWWWSKTDDEKKKIRNSWDAETSRKLYQKKKLEKKANEVQK